MQAQNLKILHFAKFLTFHSQLLPKGSPTVFLIGEVFNFVIISKFILVNDKNHHLLSLPTAISPIKYCFIGNTSKPVLYISIGINGPWIISSPLSVDPSINNSPELSTILYYVLNLQHIQKHSYLFYIEYPRVYLLSKLVCSNF